MPNLKQGRWRCSNAQECKRNKIGQEAKGRDDSTLQGTGWSCMYDQEMIGVSLLIAFFKKIYFVFLQKGRESYKELETSMREKHRSAASCTPPLGMYVLATKVLESNLGLFSLQADALSTEPNQFRLCLFL
uniref:Uncharacterized protein n=1 Tax=Pipistrellus kuhlii TaxID=59472 RepID=A0A7J7ZJF7_PIPKU|nr:hypothetical protein mPipKuh1_009497 [Pipistrellus kuhlii]